MLKTSQMPPSGDEIARCVLDAYDQLPQKCKPLERDEYSKEWVPLSGIVLARGDHSLQCVALGTGMKCLPVSKLSIANGNVLHDSHAEIIAIRAFNRFLLDECEASLNKNTPSTLFVRLRQPEEITESSPQAFTIREDVSIHMYGSEAPCGDASMELIMAAQGDATPWTSSGHSEMQGRGSFADLGVVRRKPARPDAPLTLSKSCTDKLTLYQYTSVLRSVTSLLISPENAFVSTLTVPESQYIASAFTRAFTTSGRLNNASFSPENAIQIQPFAIQTTIHEFVWSKRTIPSGVRAISSNVSAVYTPDFSETLINGVLQGRKVGDARGASKICRRSLWSQVGRIVELLDVPEDISRVMNAPTYAALKACSQLTMRRKNKDFITSVALKGWTRNVGNDQFSLH